MKAVFLCAGYGTRLYPLTEHRPKPLLSIAGEALLSHLVAKLDPIPEMDRVILVSNARFYDHFCKWKAETRLKKKVVVLNDGTESPETRLRPIGDLKLAIQKEKLHDDLLVIAGDNLFDSDFTPFITYALSKKPAACLSVYNVGDLNLAKKYGLVRTDSTGKIIEFLEKPAHPPTTLASMGFYFLPEETLTLVDQFLETNRNPDAPGFYMAWLSKQIDVFAYQYQGTWFDIGDLESYEKADQFYTKYLNQK